MIEVINLLKIILSKLETVGDMLRSVYDTNLNDIVDNSEKLEGSTKAEVRDHTPKAHTLSSHTVPTADVNFNTKAITNAGHITGNIGTFASVKSGGLSGKYLGVYYLVGVNGGVGQQQGIVTPPEGSKIAVIHVLGDYYNGTPDIHIGYWYGTWQTGSSRIRTIHDINHSAGSNQGFIVEWTGTQIKVKNKSNMTSNQSGNVTIYFFG